MKVVTISTGDIIFVETQIKTLKKYMLDDYEYIIFNACVKKKDFSNNDDEYVFNKLNEYCIENKVQFINLIEDQEYYDNLTEASARHGYILEKVLKYMKQNPNEYLMLDCDMFLVDYLDMSVYREYECAVVIQNRGDTKYIWGGLFYFNIKRMRNLELLNDFNVGIYGNNACDTGGGTYKWINSLTILPTTQNIRYNEYDIYNKDGVKFIKHLWSCSWDNTEYPSNLGNEVLKYCEDDIRNKNNKYFCEIYDKKFLHYRAGSNWMRDNIEVHNYIKTKLLNLFS